MSRGLGHIQRSILTYLESDPAGRWEGGQCWTRISTVIRAVAGERPSVSECVSVRRAIRRLAQIGKIERQGWRELRLMSSAAERTIYDEGWRRLIGDAGKCFDPHAAHHERNT